MQRVLHTKLLRPHLREAVRHSRHKDLLERVLKTPITTIVAGAGYGKSTFAAQALEDQKVLWYRIDTGDADFTTFLVHLAAGVQMCCSDFGHLTLASLDEGSRREIEALMAVFLREFEAMAEKDLYFVFDDYHLIQNSQVIRSAMQFLLENLPEQAHVVIISRSRIHLPLSRFRVNRSLHEVTASDLRLNVPEIIRLYNGIFGIGISERIAARLEEKTQGWISGLILFHYMLKNSPDEEIEVFLKGMKGSGRIVSEYLEENVFALLSGERQDFLLRTSILSRLNTEICDRFMEMNGSAAMLRGLAEDHLFTFPLDEDGREYTYHHLFQEFLRKRLLETCSKQEFAEIHTRAGGIMEASGDHEQALKHYLTVEDYDRAGHTLSAILLELMHRGRVEFMQSCLSMIPEQLIAHYPWFCFLKANHEDFSGRFRDSLTHYLQALDLFRSRGIQAGIDLCLNLLGIRYYLTGDFDKAEQVCKQLLESSELSLPLKVEAYAHLIFIIAYMGRLTEADECFHQANSLVEKIEDGNLREMYRAWLVIYMGLRYLLAGDHEKAVSLAQDALEPLNRMGFLRLSTLCYQVLATACFYAGKYPEGLAYAMEGLKIVKEKGFRDTTLGWIKCYAAANAFGMGNFVDAISFGTESRKHFQDLGSPFGEAYACHILQETLIAKGSFQESEEMGREALNELQGHQDLPLITGPITISLADAMIQCGRFHEAENLIISAGHILSYSKFFDWWTARLKARLFWQTGQREEAVSALEDGLAIARAYHYDRWVINDRKWLIPILTSVYGRGLHRDYIRQIIASMGLPAAAYMRRLQKDTDPKIAHAARELLAGLPPQVIPGLEVRCLGKFEVLRGGELISPDYWRGRNIKMLFKLLLFYRHQGFVSKEVFMEHLWPEGDPAKTAKRFHVTLASLRRVMEPAIEKGTPSSYLKNESDNYMLDLCPGGIVDAEEFENACSLARGAENRDEAAEHLSAAVKLYRGDYLSEDLYEPWCSHERERFRELYLWALSNLIDYHTGRADYREAIEACRTYLEKDPYAEDGYQRLMRLYALSGKRAMIRKTFDACCGFIKDDLGMDLSRETILLMDELGPG